MANQPKKYKKFVATAATATLVASAIVPVASAAGFSDVAGNDHEVAINALADAGIINGYADGSFKPNQTINRGQVVKLLGRYLEAQGQEIPADWNTKQRFNDLPTTAEAELVKYAALAKDAGVFNGSNGNLNAAQTMQRQQMAVVLVRAIKEIAGVDLVADYKKAGFVTEISDLEKAYSAEQRNAIVALEYAGITNVSNFNPGNSVTRGQFASFLYRTIENVINTPEAGVAAVKAINNTTVEVTFDEEVDNVQALNFLISDLEVKNAAVKQTNKKVVVLTTAAQTADKEYTVSLGEDKIGTFKGIAAVIPTKVDLVEKSVQGKLGQQVTVKAQVTVAEGQTKAGIPVTFNVPGNNNDAVNPTLTGEAVTNDEGIATYTYTRYSAKDDTVTAYATGDRSKFSIGYVFWGVEQILTVDEVTEGTTINNGANKTYKVTYKNPTTGKPEANKTFNVGFLENMNVTTDKVANATVNGVQALQLSNGTLLDAAQITTDSKGEATFTVSGSNAEATPVVYELHSTTGGTSSKTYVASALQSAAKKVTFSAIQSAYTIELTRDGGEVAATGWQNGRVYKVLVKDKDGKIAANEVVNVALNEDVDGIIATDSKNAEFITFDNDGEQTGYAGKQITVKTNAKGEATFAISSPYSNQYATPVAWIDINTSNAVNGKLDKGEPTTVATISYFADEYLDGASLTVYKGTKKATKFEGLEVAEFKSDLVNQSGQTFGGIAPITKASYTVFNTGANNVLVYDENGANPVVVSPNRSLTITYNNGANLKVRAEENKSSAVRVVATGVARYNGKDFAFTAKEATATFTSTTAVADTFTGEVAAITTEGLTYVGKAIEKFSSTTKFFGGNGAEIFGAQNFINEIQNLTAGGTKSVNVTLIKDADGNKTFKVVSTGSGTAPVTSNEIYVTDVAVAPVGDTFKIGDTVSVTLTFSGNVNIANGQTVAYGGQTLATTGATNSKTAVFTATLTAGTDIAATAIAATSLVATDAVGTKTFTTNLKAATNADVKKAFDLTAPTVTSVLPKDGALLGSTTLVFSEALSPASRTAVENLVKTAVTPNADTNVAVAFAADNKTLNVTLTLKVAGTGTLGATLAPLAPVANFTVTDVAGNSSAVLVAGDLQTP
ncbi:S-layer homology domain-containing protein [Lysinibacillus sp. FSL W8-0992]|uniref:S-layer homology domain-containing protein n=1 Tax=Lysinibacillus sp. FSL W8-0992 TaxID=2954643 RepID=UPI0030FCE55A